MSKAKKPQSAAQNKKTTPARQTAASKSGSAAKRGTQPKAGSKGGAPAPAPKRARGFTPQRSQKSRSNAGANAQSKSAASKNEKKGLFKFRRYKKVEGGKGKKAKHPKLIVEQEENTVGFMGLTEEPKCGHHTNIPLNPNPKKGDKRAAYIRKELRYDSLDNFGEILKNYDLSETDKKVIIEYLEKRKKKK